MNGTWVPASKLTARVKDEPEDFACEAVINKCAGPHIHDKIIVLLCFSGSFQDSVFSFAFSHQIPDLARSLPLMTVASSTPSL